LGFVHEGSTREKHRWIKMGRGGEDSTGSSAHRDEAGKLSTLASNSLHRSGPEG